MSQLKTINRICKNFNIPEEFMIPTIRYFKSHDKNKPYLYSSFLRRIKKAKRVDSFPISKNLKFLGKIKTEYNYIKLKGSNNFIKSNSIKNIDEIWKEVISAKNWRRDTILYPKLYIDFNTPEGIRVRMHIRGDGGISKEGYVFYSNSERILLDQFKRDVINLFGKCNISLVNNEQKIYISKTVSRIFYEKLNYLKGLEIQYDIGIDQDILKSNPQLKSEAIKAYFDDEGRFHANSLEIVRSRDMSHLSKNLLTEIIRNPKNHRKYAPRFLLDLKTMLEEFDIEVSEPYFYKGDLLICVDPYGYLRLTVGWRLRISGEKNIKLFKDKIGFAHPKRNKKLNDYLNNIKVHKAQHNKAWKLALEMCKVLDEKNQEITVKNLLRTSNRKITQIRRWIYNLKRLGYIKERPIKNKIIDRDAQGHITKVKSKTYDLIKS